MSTGIADSVDLNVVMENDELNRRYMTQRIIAMRDQTQKLNDAGLRQTLLYRNLSASLKNTVGQPRPIRHAKAFAYHLDHVDLPVYPADQIAGSITGMWPVDEERSALPYEYFRDEAQRVLEEYLNLSKQGKTPTVYKMRGTAFEDGVFRSDNNRRSDYSRFASLMARDHYNANIKYPYLQRLIKEMTEEYRDEPTFGVSGVGGILERHFNYYYGDDVHAPVVEFNWDVANHTNLNYKDLVKRGYGDILREINERLDASTNPEKKTFYQSTKIAIEAAIAYIRKYAKALRDAATVEPDSERKAELEELARVSDKISFEKPETFFEAIQLVWYTHLIANLDNGCAMSFSRFDQYMYPFYRDDLKAGRITPERARELICALFYKINEPKMRTVQSMTVGGVDVVAGEDASNALTKMVLEVMSMLRLPYPNLSCRIDPDKSPAWLYEEAVRTIKSGGGQPLILNDSVWVPNLASTGMSIEAARDYYNQGCTEIMIQGKDSNWASCGLVFFPKYILELLREAHQDARTFEDIDEFVDAVVAKIEEDVSRMGKVGNDIIRNIRQTCQDPFASALVEGCLEKGLDYFRGGPVTGTPISISGQGLGTAADSLSMIRKFVFEDKKLTLSVLYGILENNFAGNELLRRQIDSGIDKFGNDIDEVDIMAKRLYDTYCASVKKLNDQREFPDSRFVMNVFSYNGHISLGERLGATPNGRLKGEPISDCVGPSQGADCNGPTALINSVLKLDHSNVTGCYALNMKLSPSVVKDRNGTRAFTQLLRTYVRHFGPELQVNYVDAEQLKAAQAEPEKHRDLVVRIAGYCEYFVNLDYKLQNEIIRRTLHEAM
jgi:pyruvate-formate lyase